MKYWIRRTVPIWVTILSIILWQVLCVVLRIDTFILPSPLRVYHALVEYREPLLEHALQTLVTTVAGFLIAVGFGLFMGIAIGISRAVYDGLYPMMIAFNSIPKVAIVPLLVIWFGIGTVPAVLTAFLISFFPIVVNVATGLATIEPELQDVLRSLGARKSQIVLKVGIPRSMPYFFASLKVAITLAFIGSVVSESIASNSGIGYLMIAASARFEVALVFAGFVVISIMGIIMYEVTAYTERRFTFWATRANEIVT
jgi:NitT/TauT family transport system permease protein